MTAVVLRGDARSLPLPDASVDLIVTSPPYYGLRSYTDADSCPICRDIRSNGLEPKRVIVDWDKHARTRHHYEGQIGSEETPGEWLASLLQCTREMVRVLKPTGSIFVNLADTYAAGHGGSTTEGNGAKVRVRRSFAPNPRQRPDLPDPPASWSTREARVRSVIPGVPVKSLLGMPWRFALACMDDLGLILRRDIVWAKPNPLPESVTDRCATRHEYLFHFTKLPRYYSAVDEIREPHLMKPQRRPNGHKSRQALGVLPAQTFSTSVRDEIGVDGHPLGKLPGSVWEIPSQPLIVPAHLEADHFAAFPFELPRRCILGWSPSGICLECGTGRRPVTEVANVEDRKGRKQRIIDYALDAAHGPDGRGGERWKQTVSITGYTCACPQPDAPTRPALVLDPFMGTGTSLLVADVLGRNAIGVDLSNDYCRIARWRVNDPGERARAMQVPKPPPVPDGQGSLFDPSEVA